MKNATAQDINTIMENALNAFLSFKQTSGAQRAKFLQAVAEEIEAIEKELIATAMEETNLPEARLMGEKGRTCNQLRQMAEIANDSNWIEAKIDTAIPDRTPLPKPDIRQLLVPIGPIVVFGASNFPLAYSTAGVDPASAWAAGCSVVVKAHPAHKKTSTLVAEAIHKAISKTEMHPSIFKHVIGDDFETGQMLVMHPLTAAVGFTGSFKGGKALFDLANLRTVPIPVFAEMGSTNPVFILQEGVATNTQKYATMLATSITGSVGQFCTKPGLILGVQSNEFNTFLNQLSEEITKIMPAKMLHQGIADAYELKKNEILKQVTLKSSSAAKATALEGEPCIATVSGKTFIQNKNLQEEIFGPFALIVECENNEELIAIAKNLEGQLTTTVLGTENELEAQKNLLETLSLICGRLIINGVPTGVEVCASMQHGGPFPASTDGRFGSVGIGAVRRFVRPLSYQNFPDNLLPDALKQNNPLNISRLVNGTLTTAKA